MRMKYLIVLTALVGFVLLACNKYDSGSGTAHLQVSLTDAPGNYEIVNIDVQDVYINYSTDTASGWMTLGGIKKGNYNLISLANGNEVTLTNAEIIPERIEQIRLVLGTNNYIKLGGQTYALQTPGAMQAGLRIDVHKDIAAGNTYKLLLDFDASRSVLSAGSGKYNLKPVIRSTLQPAGGSIKGYITPNSFLTAIYVLQGTDTVAGTYTSTGSYMLKGLTAGTYNVSFAPSNTGYKTQTKTAITVTADNVKIMDTVKLVP